MRRIFDRKVYAIMALIMLTIMGLIYAWSVMSIPIEKEFPQWSKAELSLTFTLLMVFFCVGQLVCGYIVNDIKPRNGIFVGAFLLLIGFYIASKAHSTIVLYLGFGLICGFGAGVAYNAVMNTMVKWYSDRPGFISGILLMGFGAGGFVIGKLYQLWTPVEIGGWRISFIFMGLVIFVILIICAIFFEKPGEDKVISEEDLLKKNDSKPIETLKNPIFWIYYLWAIVCNAAGLSLISQASGVVIEVLPYVGAAAVATLVGIISIFNALGRVIFGGIYDKFGRSTSMQLVNAMFVITAISLYIAFLTNSLIVLVVTFILGGLSYSGIPPTNSAFSREYFGAKYYGVNFSLVNSNMIIASFGSTLSGILFDITGSYNSVFILIVAFAVIGFICSSSISAIEKAKKQGVS